MEEWRELYGFIISNYGQIKNPLTHKILKQQIMQKGYSIVTLKCKTYRVHRLVWQAFNGTISSDIQIDHIDENKQNNRLDNLQLLSNRENKIKSSRHLKRKFPVGVGYSIREAKYRAYIRINGMLKHLGYFNCPTSAMLAYEKAKMNTP